MGLLVAHGSCGLTRHCCWDWQGRAAEQVIKTFPRNPNNLSPTTLLVGSFPSAPLNDVQFCTPHYHAHCNRSQTDHEAHVKSSDTTDSVDHNGPSSSFPQPAFHAAQWPSPGVSQQRATSQSHFAPQCTAAPSLFQDSLCTLLSWCLCDHSCEAQHLSSRQWRRALGGD